MKPSLNTTATAQPSGDSLRNTVIASALLAFIFTAVVAALLLVDVQVHYALAGGAIVVGLIKLDDARIRSARRRAAARAAAPALTP